MWILLQIATSVFDRIILALHLTREVGESIEDVFFFSADSEDLFIELIAHFIFMLHSKIRREMSQDIDIFWVFEGDIFQDELCFFECMFSLIDARHDDIEFTIIFFDSETTHDECTSIIDVSSGDECANIRDNLSELLTFRRTDGMRFFRGLMIDMFFFF